MSVFFTSLIDYANVVIEVMHLEKFAEQALKVAGAVGDTVSGADLFSDFLTWREYSENSRVDQSVRTAMLVFLIIGGVIDLVRLVLWIRYKFCKPEGGCTAEGPPPKVKKGVGTVYVFVEDFPQMLLVILAVHQAGEVGWVALFGLGCSMLNLILSYFNHADVCCGRRFEPLWWFGLVAIVTPCIVVLLLGFTETTVEFTCGLTGKASAQTWKESSES